MPEATSARALVRSYRLQQIQDGRLARADRKRPTARGAINGPRHHLQRHRTTARPRRRRHRPDHPRQVPQAHRTYRLRTLRLRSLGQGPRLRHQSAPVRGRQRPPRRTQLRLRLLPRARRLGNPGHGRPRRHRTQLRRHLPQQLRQDGPPHHPAPPDPTSKS